MTERVIPEAAVDAAWDSLLERGRTRPLDYAGLAAMLEAAAPHMLSNEREETRRAHLDALVNRDTADKLQRKLDQIEALFDGYPDTPLRRNVIAAITDT